MDKPESFSDITWLWPSDNELAMDLGVSPITIRSMRFRDAIDAGHWAKLVRCAKARGIPYVTFQRLAELEEQRQKVA
jgi:hypothetical protein